MNREQLAAHDWSLSRFGRRITRGRVAHVPGPRPEPDGTRTQKWPAVCGIDLRYGEDTDAPIFGTERACARCVRILDRATR